LLSYLIEPVYRSHATLLVSPRGSTAPAETVDPNQPPNNADLGAVLRGMDTLGKRPVVNTYAEIMNSLRLRRLALAGLDPRAASYDASTRLMPETNLLIIEVNGSNPQLVHDFAVNIQKSGIDFVQKMRDPYTLEVLDEPNLPSSPIQPNPQFNLLIGLMLGLGLGIGVVLLRAHWSVESKRLQTVASDHQG
jgi:capsular polysaccharide biosynthesis protein